LASQICATVVLSLLSMERALRIDLRAVPFTLSTGRRLALKCIGGGGDIGDGSNVPAAIRDLRHDGNFEFLVGNSLGSIAQRCIANWQVGYAWTGANYTDVSRRFNDFYRQRLDEINKIVPALQSVRGANGYALSDEECLKAEAAAIQRFLGTSTDAGIDQAMRLSASNDRAEREFAAELLARINNPKARECLAKLAKDQDEAVSTHAKKALSRKANAPQFAYGPFTPVKYQKAI
jgi:hypothetical protein